MSHPAYEADERVLDEGMVSERSSAAWSRTALGWLAAGAAVLKYLGTDGIFRARALGGHLMLLTAVIIYGGSAVRYWQMRHSFAAQAQGVPESDDTIHAAPRIVFSVAVMTTMACFAVLISELSSEMS